MLKLKAKSKRHAKKKKTNMRRILTEKMDKHIENNQVPSSTS
jgi:hypothetical protein